MKKLFYTSALVLCSIGAFAQGYQKPSGNGSTFGIRGAFNLSHISGTSSYSSGGSTTTSTANSSTLPGFTAGVFALIPVGSEFAIQPELDYALKGGKYAGSSSNSNYDFKLKLGYISIPILFKWQPADVAGFNVFVGPEFGYLASAKEDNVATINGTIGSASSSGVSDVKNQYKSVDVGLDVGLGYNFVPNFGIDVRYGLGLTNIAKNDASNNNNNGNSVTRNRTIQIGLSYLFGK